MNPQQETMSMLARKVAESEIRLQALEQEIREIGQPAAHELKRRLDALIIEESALKRNLSECLGMEEPDGARMAKIEALLAHIEAEEDSVKHDADFLHQSGHTSAEFAAQAGTRIVELCLHALKRVVGDRHPLGMSVFVNQTHEMLATRYGLVDEESDAPEGTRS